jgi:hypothetical protein
MTSWPFFKGSVAALAGFLGGLFLYSRTAEACEGCLADAAGRTQAFLMATSFAIGFVACALGVVQVTSLMHDRRTKPYINTWELFASSLLVLVCVVAALAAVWFSSSYKIEGVPWALLIPIFATALALPMALVTDAIRQVARKRTVLKAYTSLADAVDLRHLLRRTLTFVGAYLAVSILAVGAYNNLEFDFTTDALSGIETASVATADEPSGLGVLLFGAFFTALLAAYYLPAHAAVNRLSEQVQDLYAPYPSHHDRKLKVALERREAIGTLLGLDERPIQRLEQAILVAAPLLTGLFSVLIGG